MAIDAPCWSCTAHHDKCASSCSLRSTYLAGVLREEEFKILLAFHAELKRAESLHGPMVSVHHGAHVMWREYRELSDAIAANKLDIMDADVAKECTHVGAMALRFLKDLGEK